MTQTNAILCALAAFFGWVVVDTIIKLSGQSSLSSFAILGIMGLSGAIYVAGDAFYHGNSSTLKSHNPREQVLLCIASLVTCYGCIITLKYLPLTIFYIILFSAPLLIATTASILKHEVLTKKKIICVIAGFIGVIIAIAPQFQNGGEWKGYVAGVVTVIGFATGTLVTKRIARTEKAESLLFWSSLVFGLFGIVLAIPEFTTIKLKDAAVMAADGMLNIFCSGLYNKALRYTSATNVAQIHYTQIISGAIIGYFIWHEVLTVNLLAGSVLIIASGLVVAHQARNA